MKKTLLLFGVLFFVTHYSLAQNEKFKALFMYNFAKNIQWPTTYQSGDFVIAVYGNSPIADELKIIASKQKIGSQTIVVKTVKSANEIGDAHIVYLPENQSASAKEVVNTTANKSVLVITDKEGLSKEGSDINYIKDGGRVKYEINRAAIEKKGMSVSNSLISLGVPVN